MIRWWFLPRASVVGPLGTAGVLLFARAAEGAPVARAEVHWSGDCDDRAALERAMLSRGAELVTPSADPEGSQRGAIAVQVHVRPKQGTMGLLARLEIRDPHGGRETRPVEAQRCEELRAAVAWILVVLARERAAPAQDLATETSAFPALPAAAPCAPAPSAPLLLRGQVVLREGTVLPRPSRDLGLGTALVSGFGWAPRSAWGPSLLMEYRPWGAGDWAFRVTVAELASRPFQRAAAEIVVQRQVLRAGATTPQLGPFALSGSLEVGRLQGSGSRMVLAERDALGWVAAELSGILRFPLLGGRISGELAAGAAFSPFVYQFRYSSGTPLAQTERLELRLQAGLVSYLPPHFL